MRKITYLLSVFILVQSGLSISQNTKDSTVLLTEIKYHSEFERKAIEDMLIGSIDTFNLFMAVDKNISFDKSKYLFNQYKSIYSDFSDKKVSSKEINKKIKLVYTMVHEKFMKKYNEIEFLPSTFKDGTYNCVSASILFAMVFNDLDIPYKIMASTNHVYLVANPGEKSIVIETTNPGVQQSILNDSFIRNYVKYLKDSKLISTEELGNKSVEEIYEENQNQVKEVDFFNLAGMQYSNLGISKLKSNDALEAYELFQKAYSFYPDPQIKIMLYASLVVLTNKITYDKVEDIDYLAQLARYSSKDVLVVPQLFYKILNSYLEYTDKESYCDSLYNRLTPQITNKKISDEVSFLYWGTKCQLNQFADELEYYAYNALKIKPTHRAANQSFEYAIRKKYEQINESQVLLDTVLALKKRYNQEVVKNMFDDYEIIAIIGLAYEYYKKKNPEQGEIYLQKFEKMVKIPIKNSELQIKTVDAYRVKAEYYFDKRNKAKEKEAYEMALKFVPGSSFIRTLMKDKGFL